MTDDWIKMRIALPTDPRVIGMAHTLGVSRQHVIGCLLLVWGVADQHAVEIVSLECPAAGGTFVPYSVPQVSGVLSRYTVDDIDSIANQVGFGQQMIDCQWIMVTPQGITFPDWDKHHSKSAKKRSCDTKKKNRQRHRQVQKAKMSPLLSPAPSQECPAVSGTKRGTREEKILGNVFPKNPSCPDLPQTASPDLSSPLSHDQTLVLMVFPTTAHRNPSKEWSLLHSKVAEWVEAFPNVDVPSACQQALQWLRDHPEKQKTARGMLKFLSGWLARNQNESGGSWNGQHRSSQSSRDVGPSSRVRVEDGNGKSLYAHIGQTIDLSPMPPPQTS